MRWIAVLLAVLPAACLGGCAERPEVDARPLVMVSVLPQKYFVERIAGDRVRVEVMIPPGASPGFYEPTIGQLKALSAASLYVEVGHPSFPFEKAWLGRLLTERADLAVTNASAGISHAEPDPHLWVSPRHALEMTRAIAAALEGLLPEHEAELDENLRRFESEVRDLDAKLHALLDEHRGGRFFVFHPAWGYFAREYGLVQVAIEREGKEPDPREVATLIREAREAGVRVIFVQPQFDPASAELIAREISASVEVLDPLAPDWSANLYRVGVQLRGALVR
jgi:zinc transport system substrate-binding protein